MPMSSLQCPAITRHLQEDQAVGGASVVSRSPRNNTTARRAPTRTCTPPACCLYQPAATASLPPPPHLRTRVKLVGAACRGVNLPALVAAPLFLGLLVPEVLAPHLQRGRSTHMAGLSAASWVHECAVRVPAGRQADAARRCSCCPAALAGGFIHSMLAAGC